MAIMAASKEVRSTQLASKTILQEKAVTKAKADKFIIIHNNLHENYKF